MLQGPLPFDYVPEFFPVDGAEIVVAARFVPLQVGVRNAETEHFHLFGDHIHEAPAQFVVAEAFDLPLHALRAVDGVGIRRTEHHHGRPVPAVDGVLRHGALFGRAFGEREQNLEALTLVKTFFLADAHHGAGIRTVGAAANGYLVEDGGAVDEPADGADVGPGNGGIVENGGIFGLPAVQFADHLVAADANVGIRGT